ncbi:MAG TPA: GNAT family N-acetyltransferase [Paraburkholderia sp.]|jgi:hypothetical protein
MANTAAPAGKSWQSIEAAQHIEEAAYFDLFEAAPGAYASANRMRAVRLPDATCFANRGVAIPLFNRVLRMGAASVASEADLDHALDWMREYAAPHHTIALDKNAQPESLQDWLHARDYVASASGLARFSRDPSIPAAAVDSRYTVLKIGNERQEDFGRVVQEGFGFPPSLALWMSRIPGRDRWHTYLACDGDTPVAAAAMYVDRGTAWLGVGATLPHCRQGGAQGLLLARRIADAIGLGVDGMHVETGQPADGEPIGPSYRNILRAGFKLLFVRKEYAPAKKS